ncbi:MAG: alpha/beta hydrolase, partial [Candidatus Eremiobacterota bacterium]
GNISYRLHAAEAFRALGCGVVLFDYRGYGRSQGTPSEEGLYRDAEAVWTHLTHLVPPDRIVIMGESLGGGVATYLAERNPPAGLILQSTYTSLPELASELYPMIPSQLCRFRFPSRDRIARISCPKLVMHGRADEVIPYHHGRVLYEAAAEPRRFVELPGGHNDDPFTAEVSRQLDAFLSECSLSAP